MNYYIISESGEVLGTFASYDQANESNLDGSIAWEGEENLSPNDCANVGGN